MMAEATRVRRVAEHAMNGRRLKARVEKRLVYKVAVLDSRQRLLYALAHPIGGFASWCCQRNL